MDSVSSVVGIAAPLVLPKGIVEGGRRARAREKAGEGKTVRDLTRIFVIVSGWMRWGLNWYLRCALVSECSCSTRERIRRGIVVVYQIELINISFIGFQVIGNVVKNVILASCKGKDDSAHG